jgi:hypothetical protein
MHDDNVGDRRVSLDGGGNFGAARWHVVAFVDDSVVAVQIFQRLCDPHTVCAVA